MEFLKVTAQTWVSMPTILCGTTLDDLDDGGPVVSTGTLPEIYPGQVTEFIGVGRVDVDEEAACAVLTDEHFWWLPLPDIKTQDQALAWLQAQAWTPEFLATFEVGY